MEYLFWCAFDHLTFRIAEFESICKVLKIPLVWLFKNQTHPWVTLKLNSGQWGHIIGYFLIFFLV